MLSNRNIIIGCSTIVLLRLTDIAIINRDRLTQFEGINIKDNRHMKSVIGDNTQPLSRQLKQQETSGAEKYPSRAHPTSCKGKLLIACGSNNITTVCNMDRGRRSLDWKIRRNQDSKSETIRAVKSLERDEGRYSHEMTTMRYCCSKFR